MKEQRGRLIVGSVVSLALLAWVFWHTDWQEVARSLRSADITLLFAASLAVGVGLVLRAWRWAMMLEAEHGRIPYVTVFDIVNLGYLANNLLPARLGDLLRAYLARDWTRASFAFAISTTVVERVLDTLVLVILLFGVLPFLPVPPLAARAGLMLGTAFFLAGVVLVVAAWRREESQRLISVLLRPLPLDEKVWSERAAALLGGFALVRQPVRFARVLFATSAIWIVSILSYWFVFQAFGLGLRYVDGAFTISLAGLGMALPSGPAAAGTFDAAAGGALEILGVSRSLAYGVALVIHIINFLVITLFGLWSMVRRGFSVGTLAARAEVVKS